MKRILACALLIVWILSLGVTIHVRASYAVPTEKRIEYTGDVHAILEEEGIELWTESMTVEKIGEDWNLIDATDGVKVRMENIEATSSELEYRVDSKKGIMRGNVSIFVEDENVLIRADRVDFDRGENLYSGSSEDRVIINWKDVVLRSEEFVYDKDESKMTLIGNFEAVQTKKKEKEEEKIRLEGEKAEINTASETMMVYGGVKVEYGETEASCDELSYDMKSRGRLTGNVETLIRPKGEEGTDTYVYSDVLEFDTEKDWYSGYSENGKVKIVRGQTTIYSKRFEFFRKEGKVILDGGVEIEDSKRNVKIKADRAVVYTEEERMELWNVKMDIER